MASDLRSPDSLSRQPARDRPVDPASREAEIAAMLPLNFDPVAEDYVGAYLYLASRTAARVCTGSIIACDGGIDIRGIRPLGRGAGLRRTGAGRVPPGHPGRLSGAAHPTRDRRLP